MSASATDQAPEPRSAPSSEREPEQPSRGVAVPAAVGTVVAAVVAALAVVGLVVSLTTDRLPTGPALAPPPPPAAEVSYDEQIRQARYAQVTVTMPGIPYECPSSLSALPPILGRGLLCSAAVHPDYRGTSDWAATAGFGSVPAGLERATAEETADAVFEQLQIAAFADEKITLSDQETAEVDLQGHQVAVVQGKANYRVDGVPSSYDRMVVVALPLADDRYAIYLSSRPNDTPQIAVDALNASLNSLRYN